MKRALTIALISIAICIAAKAFVHFETRGSEACISSDGYEVSVCASLKIV